MSSSRRSSSGSELSDIQISENTGAQVEELRPETQKNVKPALKFIKKKNRKIKFANIKGKEHPSSTVPAQGEVVSIQCQDADGGYLGTFHMDTQGNTYTNKKFDKIAEQSQKK